MNHKALFLIVKEYKLVNDYDLLDCIALADIIYDIYTFDHLAETGMISI
jgi:hypothetical protein